MAKEQTNQPGELSIDEQLKALELEERQQALESKKIQDELARIQLNEKRQEIETRKTSHARGKLDAQKANADRKAERDRCNHHVGGEGAMAIVYGMGDMERPTAISGIQFLDESILLRCNRCGKPWRSNLPNGDENHGPWAEGVQLFRRSQFKTIAIVGGVKVQKQQPAVA